MYKEYFFKKKLSSLCPQFCATCCNLKSYNLKALTVNNEITKTTVPPQLINPEKLILSAHTKPKKKKPGLPETHNGRPKDSTDP
jgi:hypothetical protein